MVLTLLHRYIYMCVCVYIYIYTSVFTLLHICIYVHIYIYMYIYMYVHISTGDFFGEVAVLLMDDADFTMIATSESHLLFLSAEVHSLCDSYTQS